ncbi:hypothetical protein L228DRAFT_248154 [Xylona heveae TC161]|uniref:Zn(2)-C6 fungal-type domain-containing protein n=1 Tax=Xylona heveae (strain CBS 132557 / TC161) TaxID=1328760 RepID=A0A165GQ58_XYLHT|nr:hypothetical protein L228DRAFT_248154 [Xylona heveae TC161]KZF22460.1 hypothetical protein L228DRAFT_248154 [Xylona heveae TC161]
MSAETYSHHPARPGLINAKIKPRKLREACDNCHVAKVKCTKSRPTCDRCHSAGAPCTYSPSARMGKPRQRASTDQPKVQAPATYLRSASLSSVGHSNLGMDLTAGLKWFDVSDVDTFSFPRNDGFQPSLSEAEYNFSPLDLLLDAENGHMTPNEDAPRHDSFGTRSPSSVDFLSSSAEGALADSPTDSCPSLSLGPADMSLKYQWHPSILSDDYQQLLEMKAPSPRPYPTPGSTHHSLEHNPLLTKCNCASLSLQTMQNLFSHFEPSTALQSSPLDLALSTNKEAIAHCSAMLDCDTCLTSPDGSAIVMLLAILLGKIVAFYTSACRTYFSTPVDSRTEPGTLHLSLGAYRIEGESKRKLEMEILLIELRMVEATYNKFKETCNILRQTHQHASGVYDAMIVYLARELNAAILAATSNIVE